MDALFMKKFLLGSLLTLLLSCKPSDEQKILGKWQSDQDWFVFKNDKTYDAGKAIIPMVHGFRYTIDPKEKRLTMYTDKAEQSFYLEYIFLSDDTLSVRNSLSTNKRRIIFYKVEEGSQP